MNDINTVIIVAMVAGVLIGMFNFYLGMYAQRMRDKYDHKR